MIVWSQSRYGTPDVVQRAERPVPEPGRGEVLVRIGAASLNSADVRIMRGEPLLVRLAFGLRGPKTPVPGHDVAGTVAAVGEGVDAVAVGDRVAGELSGAGGLAEYVVAPARRWVPVPDGVDDLTAAALPMAGGTAWQALDLGEATSGSRVLVLGAGGGVGTFAVRLAVLRGAEVHALCSARAMETVAALGAESVGDRAEGIGGAPPASFDAVIDLGGRARLSALQALLRDGGTAVGIAVGENRIGPAGRMLGSAFRSIGSRRRIRMLAATIRPDITARLLGLAASGELVPVVERVYDLADADAALRRMDDGGVVGKLLVQPR